MYAAQQQQQRRRKQRQQQRKRRRQQEQQQQLQQLLVTDENDDDNKRDMSTGTTIQESKKKENIQQPAANEDITGSSRDGSGSSSSSRSNEPDDGGNSKSADGDGGGPAFLSRVSAFSNIYGDSKIPTEIRQEIYDAEGRTAAAQGRTTRISTYIVLAIIGISFCFFNAFLTELRQTPNIPIDTITIIDSGTGTATNAASSSTSNSIPTEMLSLSDTNFGWIESNFLTNFMFTNKMGGFLSLAFGCGMGLLAESEFDTKRTNAEKIYEELVRRRTKKMNNDANKAGQQQQGGQRKQGKSRRRSNSKESKRIMALSELVLDDDDNDGASSNPQPADATTTDETVPSSVDQKNDNDDTGNIFNKVKEFYNKADSMAASQALLLNKKLEDEGILEKITDDTGFKVIGRDAVIKKNNKNNNKKKEEQEKN